LPYLGSKLTSQVLGFGVYDGLFDPAVAACLCQLAERAVSVVADLNQGQRHAGWKVQLADQLQREMGVPVVWLAVALNWGRPVP